MLQYVTFLGSPHSLGTGLAGQKVVKYLIMIIKCLHVYVYIEYIIIRWFLHACGPRFITWVFFIIWLPIWPSPPFSENLRPPLLLTTDFPIPLLECIYQGYIVDPKVSSLNRDLAEGCCHLGRKHFLFSLADLSHALFLDTFNCASFLGSFLFGICFNGAPACRLTFLAAIVVQMLSFSWYFLSTKVLNYWHHFLSTGYWAQIIQMNTQ